MSCNCNFYPILSERVDIKEYSKKIHSKAVTFEAWYDNLLVGLVAAYFNDKEFFFGFITNVSIFKEFMGKGIACKLLEMSVGYARKTKFKIIGLEVHKDNKAAIKLYKKFKFKIIASSSKYKKMSLKLI